MPANPRSAVPISEAQVLRSCMALLKFYGLPAVRQNTGATSIGKRFVRFGEPGASDITSSYAMPEGSTPEARKILVECKRPATKGKPAGTLTHAQWEYLQRAKREGAITLVVWGVDDLRAALDRLREDPHATFDLPLEPKEKIPAKKQHRLRLKH